MPSESVSRRRPAPSARPPWSCGLLALLAATAGMLVIAAGPVPAHAQPAGPGRAAGPLTVTAGRQPDRRPGLLQGQLHSPPAAPRGIAAAGAELMDATTGSPLWGRARYRVRPVASITKVMTALVVLRARRLSRRITITSADVSYVRGNGASNAGLHAGDVLTTRQLLAAMLLPSGADAARALAVAYGPGWPAFVAKMNRLARRLGMAETHFVNFDGLLSADRSTPSNLLRLGQAAMRQPALADIVRRRFFWLPAGRHHHSYLWRNTNLLLPLARYGYPGVTGIKTGWTPAAGECLLFEAKRGKRVLIGVLLDSSPVNGAATFRAAARLLSWGFQRLRAPAAAPPRHRRSPRR